MNGTSRHRLFIIAILFVTVVYIFSKDHGFDLERYYSDQRKSNCTRNRWNSVGKLEKITEEQMAAMSAEENINGTSYWIAKMLEKIVQMMFYAKKVMTANQIAFWKNFRQRMLNAIAHNMAKINKSVKKQNLLDMIIQRVFFRSNYTRSRTAKMNNTVENNVNDAGRHYVTIDDDNSKLAERRDSEESGITERFRKTDSNDKTAGMKSSKSEKAMNGLDSNGKQKRSLDTVLQGTGKNKKRSAFLDGLDKIKKTYFEEVERPPTMPPIHMQPRRPPPQQHFATTTTTMAAEPEIARTIAVIKLRKTTTITIKKNNNNRWSLRTSWKTRTKTAIKPKTRATTKRGRIPWRWRTSTATIKPKTRAATKRGRIPWRLRTSTTTIKPNTREATKRGRIPWRWRTSTTTTKPKTRAATKRGRIPWRWRTSTTTIKPNTRATTKRGRIPWRWRTTITTIKTKTRETTNRGRIIFETGRRRTTTTSMTTITTTTTTTTSTMTTPTTSLSTIPTTTEFTTLVTTAPATIAVKKKTTTSSTSTMETGKVLTKPKKPAKNVRKKKPKGQQGSGIKDAEEYYADPRKIEKPPGTENIGSILGSIFVVLILVASTVAALFCCMRRKKPEVLKISEISVTPAERGEWRPEHIGPEKFNYKGPLSIPVSYSVVLEHDLDKEEIRPVTPDQHVQFDDTLNEAHEFGSDVEIITDAVH